VCDACFGNNNDCQQCGTRDHVFEGDQALDQFCNWLFDKSNKGSVAIAHNSKGYF
jgi:hypothetical protein